MSSKIKAIAIGVIFLAGSASVMAQSGPVRPAYAFPSSERSGGKQMGDSAVFASPYASASIGYDSNLFQSSKNEVDTQTQKYDAGVKVDARGANSVFMMDLRGRYARYSESADDNYSEPRFLSSYDMAFDQRHFLRAGFDYIRTVDPRGSVDRPSAGSPDKYFESKPYLTYAFGAPGAQGRVELWASNTVRRYLNNTATTAAFDRDNREIAGAFYWRVAPKTSLVVEARENDISYKQDSSKQSGKENRLYAGVSWEATAATTGIVKVGRLEKKFDSTLPSTSDTSWEATLNWKPRSYSVFDLYTLRTTAESTGLGNYTLSDRYGLNWTHGWSDIFSTDVFGNYTKDRYQGAPRTDEITILGLRGSYKFRRWLTLAAEYSFNNRDSNVSENNYDRNIFFVTASFTM